MLGHVVELNYPGSAVSSMHGNCYEKDIKLLIGMLISLQKH